MNFMALFYGSGSTASRLEPLWGGGLLFTTKFPEIPGTHVSSGILIPVYQWEHPNSGSRKNKKAVTVLFMISSSND